MIRASGGKVILLCLQVLTLEVLAREIHQLDPGRKKLTRQDPKARAAMFSVEKPEKKEKAAREQRNPVNLIRNNTSWEYDKLIIS
jgi:hypothetical protein